MAGSIDINEVGSHVSDANGFHLPEFMGGHLPDFPKFEIFGHDFQITKFMVLELVVAILLVLFFLPLSRKISGGKLVKGRFWNMLEAFLLYLRNEVITPAIGHEASKYVPYLWTLFFFILGCNLTGMLPWCGSPTGNLSVTAVLAGITYLVIIGGGMLKQGIFTYWVHQVPRMDLPGALAIILKPMIFVIEVLGLVIKCVVLSVRLLANMFAGHVVLAVFLAFIAATASNLILWVGVTTGSVLMSLALDCLELFVAFLQAYIFMFLAAIFIGMAQHQH